MTERKTNHDIRRMNRLQIYQTLRENGNMTKQEIAYQTGFSLPTVAQNLGDLAQAGLVQENGCRESTGGRRAKSFGVIPQARIAIGLDITAGGVSAAAVDLNGRIISRAQQPVPFQPGEAYYQALGGLICRLAADFSPRQILGVGIGVPGLITPDHRKIFCSKVQGFENITCQDFSRFIPFPTRLYHDANAAGFAEQWTDGDGGDFFYIMLSRTVGGTFVHAGQPYRGENLRAGEVGHISIVPDGKRCYCGKRGCADAYCASSVLAGCTGGSLQEFFRRLEGGDEALQGIFDEYLAHLAYTVNSVRMLFDCRVILGGHMGRYLQPYLPRLRRLAGEKDAFGSGGQYIHICRYQDEPIAAGAALGFVIDFLDKME